jgi:hypothetical protein
MKEHPILFSTPMVQAILDGRKTMTRRVMDFPQSFIWNNDYFKNNYSFSKMFFDEIKNKNVAIFSSNAGQFTEWFPSQYGQVGDRLWVRETWSVTRYLDGHYDQKDTISYRANNDKPYSCGWRPSIFMPRWASRITLEITNIRVERLQEITEEDAINEGIEIAGKIKSSGEKVYKNYLLENNPFTQARYSFQSLWDSINGKKYPWSSNPFVWVVEFKVEVTP